jgi:hypothetical protein
MKIEFIFLRSILFHMDRIKLSQGEIKLSDKAYIDKSIKLVETDALFAYYTKPRGKKQILVNYQNPGDFFMMDNRNYYTTKSQRDTIELIQNLIKMYPELDSVELKMWIINLEIIQSKSYITNLLTDMMKTFNLKTVSYKYIIPVYINKSIYDYIDYTGITEDELILYLERIIDNPSNLDYYLGLNYIEFIEKTIQNKKPELIEMLIRKKSNISEKFIKLFKPKLGLKLITSIFDKKEYNNIQYCVYKECLTESQREEFLPKMKEHIYAFNYNVTYEDYLELFEGKIEITKFAYKKWIMNSKNRIEMYKKMKPYMDIYGRKEIIIKMIEDCFTNDSLDNLLKIFID